MKKYIEDTCDIFLISETKIDNCFPNSQFSINGYRMFQRDRDCFSGDLCFYVKDSIASKQLNSHRENIDAEAIYLEIKYKEKEMAGHSDIQTSKPKQFSIFRKSVE